MKHVTLLTQTALVASLGLFAPSTARAQSTYKIQPILQPGDAVGGVVLPKSDGNFVIGTLNDSGQLVFSVTHADGSETLIQYADGKLTRIMAAGQDAPIPGGKWPRPVFLADPVSMNQLGNVVFAAGSATNDTALFDTFLWDYKAQKVLPVALKGMPAVNNLTFETGGDYTPGINNFGDIAFPAKAKNAAGKTVDGLFFLGRDGKLLPVVLPDQELPDGGKVDRAGVASLNDAGVVGFAAERQGRDGLSGYLWEKGAITPVAVVDTDAPGGGKIADVPNVRVNNKNRSVLVRARLHGSAAYALYRFADGKLTPVVVPGQVMPDGGKVVKSGAVSYANGAGEHAFLAMLEGGATAAYRIDADGKLSLILKSGTTTDLGMITHVGGETSSGIGLNTQGQVAVVLTPAGGPDIVVLLSPPAL
jgi:hypothetical protein